MTLVADCMMSFFRSKALPLLGATVLISQPFWMYLRAAMSARHTASTLLLCLVDPHVYVTSPLLASPHKVHHLRSALPRAYGGASGNTQAGWSVACSGRALGEHEGCRAGDVRRGHGGPGQLHVQAAQPGGQNVHARRHHVHRVGAVVAPRPA